MITTSQILAKIEGELGYVEMGNKTIGERVSAILAEINKIKKSQTELIEKLDEQIIKVELEEA